MDRRRPRRGRGIDSAAGRGGPAMRAANGEGSPPAHVPESPTLIERIAALAFEQPMHETGSADRVGTLVPNDQAAALAALEANLELSIDADTALNSIIVLSAIAL